MHGCEAREEDLSSSYRSRGPWFWTSPILLQRADRSEAGCPVPSPFPHQVYSADGEFLFKFGSHGEGNGQFNAPTGVAVDSNGNIIVADWGNSRIQVSRSQGWLGVRFFAVLIPQQPLI